MVMNTMGGTDGRAWFALQVVRLAVWTWVQIRRLRARRQRE